MLKILHSYSQFDISDLYIIQPPTCIPSGDLLEDRRGPLFDWFVSTISLFCSHEILCFLPCKERSLIKSHLSHISSHIYTYRHPIY